MSDKTQNFPGWLGRLIVEPLAMPAVKARALIKQIASLSVAAPLSYDDGNDAGKCDGPDTVEGYIAAKGVATIPIIGVLTKYPSYPAWIDKYCGFVPSTLVKATIDKALADWTVKTIDFLIDCPGGLYAGTNELGDYIAKINGTGPGQKQCRARISDLAASGGYWIASQCGSISCNAGGFSGCIGVYSILLDDSKFWEEMGVSWELISSGGVKGLGADGKVTPELRSDVQREIDAMFARFTGAVSAGRKMTPERARSLGDGRSWIANEALNLGLIDEVLSVEDSMAALLKEMATMPITPDQFSEHAAKNPGAAEVQALVTQGVQKATAELTAAAGKPATAQELSAAFPADPAFVVSQLTAGATLATALTAGCQHLSKQLADAKELHAAQMAAKDGEHFTALAAKDKEIEKARFENSGGRTIAAGAKKEGDKEPSAEGDPKATAEAEWEANADDCQKTFISKDIFVRARLRSLTTPA